MENCKLKSLYSSFIHVTIQIGSHTANTVSAWTVGCSRRIWKSWYEWWWKLLSLQPVHCNCVSLLPKSRECKDCCANLKFVKACITIKHIKTYTNPSQQTRQLVKVVPTFLQVSSPREHHTPCNDQCYQYSDYHHGETACFMLTQKALMFLKSWFCHITHMCCIGSLWCSKANKLTITTPQLCHCGIN